MIFMNMENLSTHNITLDAIKMPLYELKGITVDVLRLDKIDKVISGNKWFKLKYYLEEALPHQKKNDHQFWRPLFKSHYCYCSCLQIVWFKKYRSDTG